MTDHIELIDLCANRRLINKCKKAGFDVFNPRGAWTKKFGYEKIRLHVRLLNQDERDQFESIKNSLSIMTRADTLTPERRMLTWSRRLAKLTGISIDAALTIAADKLEYKQSQIAELEEREYERSSIQRTKLIKKINRSNPLRRIKDVDHAFNIIAASERHTNTNYESQLEEGRYLASIGELDPSEVHEWAHRHKKSY